MRYIKTFENSKQLNMGDYIIFFNDWGKFIRKNHPYQITSIDSAKEKAYFDDDRNVERNFKLIEPVYKKISQEEADKLLINNKYNL